MNRNTAQILILAALSSFSATSMAFGKAAVRTETRVEIPVATPSMKIELKNPTATEIKVNGTMIKSDIVLGAKKADLKGKGCDAAMFDRAAAGTSVDAATLRNLQAHNTINVDNLGCDPNPEAFVEYKVDAREVAEETALCTFNKGIEHVAGLDARATIGGPCLADVKRAHGQTEATTASETINYKKVAEKCNIFPKDAVTAN